MPQNIVAKDEKKIEKETRERLWNSRKKEKRKRR